jgi:arginine N-succinyltransferase
MLIVRPARENDIDAFFGFAARSGPGFTSLPEDRDVLATRLAKSTKTFGGTLPAGEAGVYLLMIEPASGGPPFGCCAVKTNIGADVPFFNYRIVVQAQASKAAGRRFDMRKLVMVNDYTGCTEVGTLFLEPEHRGDGAGKLLSLSRFMLMAADPGRFQKTVVSELRGMVHIDGRSPFWEVCGRPFYQMDFAEADNMSATTDSQFIIDLAPKHPIYIDLLPDTARGAIGQCHPDGVAARRLLEKEGLRFEGVIDIFDGGPLLACQVADTRCVRESRRLPFVAGHVTGEPKALLSNDSIADFRCTFAPHRLADSHVVVDATVLKGLGLQDGAEGRVRWFDV